MTKFSICVIFIIENSTKQEGAKMIVEFGKQTLVKASDCHSARECNVCGQERPCVDYVAIRGYMVPSEHAVCEDCERSAVLGRKDTTLGRLRTFESWTDSFDHISDDTPAVVYSDGTVNLQDGTMIEPNPIMAYDNLDFFIFLEALEGDWQ